MGDDGDVADIVAADEHEGSRLGGAPTYP